MYEIHQNHVSSDRALILNMLYVSGIFLCSLCRFLHPNSFIPLLYLPFHLNLSPLAYFAASSYSFHSSIFLPLPSSVSFPFTLLLPLQSVSPSIPPSFSLKQKSWLPSYLQPPCSDVNHDQQTLKTYISLAGFHRLFLSPSSWLFQCYVSACQERGKKQVKGLLYFALSWQIINFNTLSLLKFEQLTQVSRM